MPRTRSLAWSQLKIGFLTLSALVLAAVFIYFVGGQGGFFWQQYQLKTRFADVQGLQTGAAVRVAGVTVGSVDAMEFVGSQVEVTFSVSEDMRDKITTASHASIGSLSLLGAAVIDVAPAPGGRPLGDWEYVPSRRTPGQLSDVADQATRALDQATALLRDIRAGKGTVGRLFTDEALYREITAFVTAAEGVAGALNTGQGTLGQLIHDPAAYRALNAALANLTTITDRMARGEGSLGRLINDDSFASALTTTTQNLGQLTEKMNASEGTLGKMVNDPSLFNRLDSVSARLDALIADLNDGEGTAGRLLQDRQLYENMNGAVSELRDLLGDIRKDPKKYLNVRVSIF
jgi:phospholipid/cholesterol/gamma-HCH transport system substrate-binding protein